MELFQVGGISLFRELLSSDIDKCIFDLIIFFKFFFMLFYIVGSIFFICSCFKRCVMVFNDLFFKIL